VSRGSVPSVNRRTGISRRKSNDTSYSLLAEGTKLMGYLMIKARSAVSLSAWLVLALLLSLLPAVSIKPALAHPDELRWSIVDTPAPGQATNIIVSPSEINAIAIGSDGTTFYAVDTPNSRVYKSDDGGITWEDELSGSLTADGANLPVWDIAVAPDNVNLVVAVTCNSTTVAPVGVFVSEDGGVNWDDTNFPPLGSSENISCVAISMECTGGQRDIAIGTRTRGGTGKVYVVKAEALIPVWVDQGVTGDVVELKFSPTYEGDHTIVVVYSDATGTYLNAGDHDIALNTTDWLAVYAAPIEVTTGAPGTSANCTQIITTDLELPSDFSGSDPNLRRYYVSTDAFHVATSTYFGRIYRIDDTVVYSIEDPNAGRVSSIAYYGTYDSGKLLAGEVTADPSSGTVDIRRTSNPTATTPTWKRSDPDYKSPTGGGNTGRANAQVAWSPNGDRAYCGTSSANLTTAASWPSGYLTGSALDESAFSISPYAPFYEDLLDRADKSKDSDVGDVWNQLSLIDTEISHLSDVAVLEVPEDSEDYPVLYLASVNDNATVLNNNFDSVWRSTSDPLGDNWERILCAANATANDEIILRINPRDPSARSDVIVYARLGTNDVGYSPDEGQHWQVVSPGSDVTITDLTLASDDVMYILSNLFVRRGTATGSTTWTWQSRVHTMLDSGHTIATPLENPPGEYGVEEDWVIVGEGVPGQGRVAYADFSQEPVKFEPAPEDRIGVPVPGNVHVMADDEFEQNKTIYAASHDVPGGTSGKIYRWVTHESTSWDELEPPNSAFYGLTQQNGVLYGAWRAAIPANIPPGVGVDRSLYPRATVPPSTNLEWDDLTEGLITGVVFTREPSSLKISSNDDVNLWAIDNRNYNWATNNGTGCLWAYTDTLAKVGPWTTSPASGDLIPVDPVSGRANEINFKWRQLSYAWAYELELAKDEEFSLMVMASDNITPPDPLSPASIAPAGAPVTSWVASLVPGMYTPLEASHTYYWRVRARSGVSSQGTIEEIRSPWSATMFFTVKAGLPVRTEHLGPVLLNPVNCARDVSLCPAFSWAPIPGTTRYEFTLAEDPALTQVIAQVTVPTTAYEYDGNLNWNTAYFWQVKAIEPIVSEPSPVATFTVISKGRAITPSSHSPPLPAPWWTWIAIAIYVALVAAMLALIRTRPVCDRSETTDADHISPIINRPMNALADLKSTFIEKVKGFSPSEDESDSE